MKQVNTNNTILYQNHAILDQLLHSLFHFILMDGDFVSLVAFILSTHFKDWKTKLREGD